MKLMKQSPRLEHGLMLAATLLWFAGVGIAAMGNSSLGAGCRIGAVALWSLVAASRRTLLITTVVSMLVGIELGLDLPHVALETRLIGDIFLRMIRMIVAPLLFATITTGIAGHGELKGVGRVALKALVYFEIVTTIGLLLGSVVMNLLGAGYGIQLPAEPQALGVSGAVHTWQQVVLNLFPENIAKAVADNQVLQVAVFGALFGSALATLSEEKRRPMVSLLQSLAETMFRMTRYVMLLAPAAAGAALAATIAQSGLATLVPLAKLGVAFYVTLAGFALAVQIPSLLFYRVPVLPFLKAVSEPTALGFATTTSEAALPLLMERLEQFGVPRWIVSFVVPAGYSFNMTGSSLYLSMAAVFCAQAGGVHLSWAQQATMLLTLMLASKGIAGVPRAVPVVLLATASAIQLPTAPILLLLGIDTLMDMGRTAVNVAGNGVAAAMLAASEGEGNWG